MSIEGLAPGFNGPMFWIDDTTDPPTLCVTLVEKSSRGPVRRYDGRIKLRQVEAPECEAPPRPGLFARLFGNWAWP